MTETCQVVRRETPAEAYYTVITTMGRRYSAQSEENANELAKRWNAYDLSTRLAYAVMEMQQSGFESAKIDAAIAKAQEVLNLRKD